MRLGEPKGPQSANIRMIHRRSTPRPWESEPSGMDLNAEESTAEEALDRLDHIGDMHNTIGFSPAGGSATRKEIEKSWASSGSEPAAGER